MMQQLNRMFVTNETAAVPQRILSWNVRGLNVPEKRGIVLRELHRLKVQICYIQETHFVNTKIPSFRDIKYPHAHHAPSPDTKSKGVSILISKTVPWKLEEEWTDGTGRLLFLKGTIGPHKCTLANIYLNTAPITFLTRALEQLDKFAEGLVMIGGDFNAILNSTIDASTSTYHMTHGQLNKL